MGTPELDEIPIEPREFGLARKYKIRLLSAGFACVLAAFVLSFSMKIIPLSPPHELAVRCSFMLFFFFLFALLLLMFWIQGSSDNNILFRSAFRVRIDVDGIHWRSLWTGFKPGWVSWSWDHFRKGRILPGPEHLMIRSLDGTEPALLSADSRLPTRPESLLCFRLLEPEDATFLFDLCMDFWVPPEFEVKDEYEIRRKRGVTGFLSVIAHKSLPGLAFDAVTFSPKGIRLALPDRTHEYTWDQVSQVVLKKVSPEFLAFKELRVVLPAGEICLPEFDGRREPPLCEMDRMGLGRMVEKHVPADRVHVDCSHGGKS